MGLQEGLLDEVGGVDLALEPDADLEPGQQAEVIAIDLQQLAEGRAVAGPGPPEQRQRIPFGGPVVLHGVGHRDLVPSVPRPTRGGTGSGPIRSIPDRATVL